MRSMIGNFEINEYAIDLKKNREAEKLRLKVL